MFSNTNYIKWLDTFTLEHPNFTDEDWLYFPKKIKEEDYDNVSNLHLLYEGIERYARKNYIYPTKNEFRNIYNLKFENTYFEIGILHGQGTIFFCNKVNTRNNNPFMDFYNIINNNKLENVDSIENKLNELSNLIIPLYQDGIPFEAITMTLENTLNEINNKNKIKTLKRTY